MCFRRSFRWLGILLAVGASGASAADRVQVQRITPAGEEVPAGRQIVIQFNRPMVPLGRMSGAPTKWPCKSSRRCLATGAGSTLAPWPASWTRTRRCCRRPATG